MTGIHQLAVSILILASIPFSGNCDIIIQALEINENIVLRLSGQVNLAGASMTVEEWDINGSISSMNSGANVYLGPPEFVPVDTYSVELAGPDSFGNVDTIMADSASGTPFSFDTSLKEIQVPLGYQSEQPLSGETVFESSGFESIGLIPGTYYWSWTGGETTITFIVGPAARPELKMAFTENELIFSWDAIPSAQYILETSSELNTSWDQLQTITAENRNEQVTIQVPDSDHQFFRFRMNIE